MTPPSAFRAKGHGSELLRAWIEDDWRSRPEGQRMLELPEGLRLRRRHIRRAIKLTGSTSPGPDGLPFKVWRLFGDFAVDLRLDAFNGRLFLLQWRLRQGL